MQHQADNVGTEQPAIGDVKVVKMVDGKPVEQELSPVEQMLARELAHCYVMGRKAFTAYKRSNLRFYASLVCNVALLAVIWFALPQ